MSEGFVSGNRRTIVSNQLLRNCTECRKCPSPKGTVAQGRETAIFDNFFDKCCQLAALAIGHGRPRLFRTKLGTWPTNSSQILPGGAAVCVANLVASSDVSPNALQVVSMAIMRYRSLVFEEVIRYRREILQCTIYRLEQTAWTLRDLSPVASLHDDAHLVSSITSVYTHPFLLEIVFFGPGALPGDHRRFTLCYEGELYRAIVDVLAYFRNARAWTPQLPDVAGLLYIRLPSAERRSPPQFIRDKAALAVSEMRHPYIRLARLLRVLNLRRACYNPHCGRVMQNGESEKAFRVCARCKMARYCSKECQRVDWKQQQYPHKEICDILHELCSIADPKSGVFVFIDACRDRQFPPERAQRLVEWICGSATTGDVDSIPMAYKELLTDTIGAAEEAGLEEEVSEDRVTLDYYCHYVYLNKSENRMA
ncbi:hypothetical protein EXIGLDRAFT_766801 [Exidia glandulosa HHB12029]|uniref:MYND-type domain-containing protein n=1 Tax=Exidia glandulosa HHB12029 TaxID=1314781 RepID=A0A165JFS1_EXIGL|nr:hypothetical protein EXIGLDRAFT_766801 [Exidia glandulosa HHB12029]